MKLARCFGLATATTLILAASPALAQSGEERGATAHLEAGAGVLASRSDDTDITQVRVLLGPEFTFGGRFMISPFVGMGTTSIDIRSTDGMPFDARLSFPWRPTLGARLGARLFRYQWFDMSLRGEFEFPLGDGRATIDSFTPYEELAEVGVDLDTIRNHVQIDHTWNRLALTARLGAHYRWWHPYIDVGFLHLDSRLSVRFDEDATRLLQQAEVDPPRRFDDGYTNFYYVVGSDFDLGRDFKARVGLTFLPTGDQMFVSGYAGFLIPLSVPTP